MQECVCIYLENMLGGSFSVAFNATINIQTENTRVFYIFDNVNCAILKTVQLSKRFELVTNEGEKGGWGTPTFCNEPNKRILTLILIIRSDKFVIRG